jgi:hypothetical protein
MTTQSAVGNTGITGTSVTSQINPMLLEIQKKLSGQRKEILTPVEINRLFQLPITPDFNLVLYRALQRTAINPDVTILQAISRAFNKDYLIPIALCLRFGADANMYVDAPKLGTIHILGYIYRTLGSDSLNDQDVLNAIVLMFLAEGSRPSLPMFDNKAGKIRSPGESSSPSLSVLEWLSDQGYTTILDRVNIGDPSILQKNVDTESLTILSIELDMPPLMGREYDPKDMHLAIRSHSPISVDKIPTPVTRVMLDYKSLDDVSPWAISIICSYQ